MKRAKPSLAYASFFLVLCTILLTLPGSAFPKKNWLDTIWFDKWVHVGMFTLLVIIWCLSASDITRKRKKIRFIFWLIAVFFIAYGAGMEFIQQKFVSNRSFDMGDIIADTIGCVVGLVYSTRRYIKK